MSFDFPNAPTAGQVFSPVGGPTYTWNGVAWAANLPPSATADTRNRIGNPALQVSQEWGNTLLGPTNGLGSYAADQWLGSSVTGTGMVSQQRVQVPTPNGSKDRIRFIVTTAKASLAAGEYLFLRQTIEGNRVADFRYGSASAKQSILRFGFKAPAGTYSISLFNSAVNRVYVANFTISAAQANTDTEQVFIIPGDVTGTWLTDTGAGLYINIVVATGTTYGSGVLGWQGALAFGTPANSNGLATLNNTFEFWDVGLYLDPLATGLPPAWTLPDETQETIACKRYWQQVTNIYSGNTTGSGGYYAMAYLPVVPRGTPAISGINGVAAGFSAAVGSITWAAPNGVQESRASSVTTNAAVYQSIFTVNSRM